MEMINSVKKSSNNYREQLLARKIAVSVHEKENNNHKEILHNQQQQYFLEEKELLEKQKNLSKEMKEAEALIEEGTNRLENALKAGVLSEANVAKLLIAGGREKLTYVNEQQQELTNNLDKLRLKRKDAFLHDQTTNKKMKQLQQKHQSSIEIIDDSMLVFLEVYIFLVKINDKTCFTHHFSLRRSIDLIFTPKIHL